MHAANENGLIRLPKLQKALVLYGLRQSYVPTDNHPVPVTRASDEVVVKILTIGLNPMDWKSVCVTSLSTLTSTLPLTALLRLRLRHSRIAIHSRP